ncbi:MAG: branched-chain amino acid aminotransferase [Parasphingorhabdus sp.]
MTQSRLPLVNFEELGFGSIFSDHMFSMIYEDGAWKNPEIHPYRALAIEPGVSMLHYGQTVFDGYKAFRGLDGEARIFRPEMNARRLYNSCQRLCIPIMAVEELIEIVIEATRQLIGLDHAWIPSQWGHSLYVRPLVIGTEPTLEVRAANSYRFMIITSPVGSYFTNLKKGVSLHVEDRFTRAASVGGLGAAKTAANYAASLLPASESRQQGFDQVLWLDGNEHRYVEEVGAMNIFFKIDGKIVTPPLGGSILPGIVRDSVLTLLNDWGLPVEVRQISIDEVIEAFRSGAMEEMFGAGTAAVICPIASIGFKGELFQVASARPGELTQRLYDELTGIQYGKLPDRHNWNVSAPIARNET